MHTYNSNINTDFTCKHCGRFVSAHPAVSGVVNRNHCPYCLYSQHLDLFEAGDRLCACKGLMAPVGLTTKQSRDKYAMNGSGELMVVHRCTNCGKLSINRAAADDDPKKILDSLERANFFPDLRDNCRQSGIQLLENTSLHLVRTRLFGAEHELSPAYHAY